MSALQEIKEALRDESLSISLGLIKKLHLAEDNAYLNVTCQLLPDDIQVIATMTWDAVGPNAGIFNFPAINDLVLIAFTENEESAFVIKRLTSEEDTIPKQAITGDMVIAALSGKKTWISSNNRINLSRSDVQPTENLVLGQIFKTFATDLLNKVIEILDAELTETHIGNLGYVTSKPVNSTTYTNIKIAINNLKTSPIEDGAIISDLSYTEK